MGTAGTHGKRTFRGYAGVDSRRSLLDAFVPPLTVFIVWRIVEATAIRAFGASIVGSTLGWDGGWYYSILVHGYRNTAGGFSVDQNTAFFPGTVWLTEPFRLVMPDRWAAFVVANLTAAAAFFCVFNAVRSYSSERGARFAIVTMAIWPASLFLWAYYSDALLVATSATAIWAYTAGKDRAVLVSVGVGACTRLVGVFLGPVLAAVRVYRTRRIDRFAVGYVASSAVGLGLVMFAQGSEAGQPLGFLRAARAWGRELGGPWQPFVTGFDDITKSFPRLHLEIAMEICAVLLLTIALAILIRQCLKGRSPLAPTVWAAVAWFVPLLSKVITSQMRYGLAAWPVFEVTSLGSGRSARLLRILGAVIGIGVSLVLLHRWAHNQFDG
jgi:hypothetical protein